MKQGATVEMYDWHDAVEIAKEINSVGVDFPHLPSKQPMKIHYSKVISPDGIMRQ